MDRLKNIYEHQASEYHKLIGYEDIDGNLLPAIERITPLRRKRVLDLGTGTGRIPLLMKEQTTDIASIDLHWDMLREHKTQRDARRAEWGLIQADMRSLPFRDGYFDIITAGWSISSIRVWEDEDWEKQVGRVLNEMHRTIKPGGTAIIIETMSTARSTPAPPTDELAEYYSWLDTQWGFTREVIQTDYQFENINQAAKTIEFFFGTDTANKVRENNWVRVPEWTGVWSKIVSG